MLASVVIANYNYGRFLRDAVESVLTQTHPETEVVIVDDGSTDDSRDILASYSDRVRVVLQENAGQRASINVGFAESHGEIVCLLDADDIFLPQKVSEVAHAFEQNPTASVVYHQLQAVGADGQEKIGNPWPRGVWKGDIRRRVERSGGWWPRPTTSALSFSRAFLNRVLPMPPDDMPSPDTYLAGAAPFHGPVVGLAAPLVRFRLHGTNMWSQGSITDPVGSDIFRLRRDRYAEDVETLRTALRERLEIEPVFSLNDHLRYQTYRRGAGEPVSLARLVAMALRCPALPFSIRWREAAKIAVGRW